MNSQRAPLPSRHALYRQNLRLARAKWGINLSCEVGLALRAYSEQLRMSIDRGDLILIDGSWYVTHSGLLRLASRRHCHGIDVSGVPEFCDPASSRWHRQDATEVLFKEWSAYQNTALDYSHGDSWDRMYQQGTKLLELFAQQDRVEIRCPKRNLQIKVSRPLSPTSQFVGYVDAFGFVDGTRCVIDWKTTAARYPDQPEGLLALDPQLACYSWLTGEPEVAFVVFVRKRMPEIQYLRSTISEEQRREFGQLVEDTVAQIEAAQFLPHPGIRFPQNGCTSCSYLGLCLQNQPLIDSKVVRRGGDLGWLDELEY